MYDEPPYVLDIAGVEDLTLPAGEQVAAADHPRKWIGMHFECCGVYTRIYRGEGADAYVGYCPRCHRQARIRVGTGGTHHRLFRAK